eukprot:scaffold160985_cov21-Tisochrysis_lutea.AAC.2
MTSSLLQKQQTAEGWSRRSNTLLTCHCALANRLDRLYWTAWRVERRSTGFNGQLELKPIGLTGHKLTAGVGRVAQQILAAVGRLETLQLFATAWEGTRVGQSRTSTLGWCITKQQTCYPSCLICVYGWLATQAASFVCGMDGWLTLNDAHWELGCWASKQGHCSNSCAELICKRTLQKHLIVLSKHTLFLWC